MQILDPATGTGTFLRQTIIQIYENFKEKHKGESPEKIKEAWNQYVPKHLLPRLNGFELMMAPYAVAHMKLAIKDKSTEFISEYYDFFERKDLFQIINQCDNLQSSYLVIDNAGTREYNVIKY